MEDTAPAIRPEAPRPAPTGVTPTSPSPASPPFTLGHFHLRAAGRESRSRAALEAFVAAAFKRHHGAVVRHFMPVLLGLYRPDGRLCSVAGLRQAEGERLYLEHYLDAPVEAHLSAHVGVAVARRSITEIGNLACDDCRSARRLFTLLPRWLHARGQDWVVFTATRTVRILLDSLGAAPIDLGPADGARVALAGDDWGHYYRHAPRVMAGPVPDALPLRRRH